MKPQLYVAFGGQTTEHEVSIKSGYNILTNASRDKYGVFGFYISRVGEFLIFEMPENMLFEDFVNLLNNSKPKPQIQALAEDFKDTNNKIIFPIIHGQTGEDGKLQGFFDILGVPYVGSSVTASAVGMDKAVMRLVAKSLNIPMARDYSENLDNIEFPVFVKPRNGGSSVGASRAENKEELEKAISLAKQYDSKVLVEQLIVGREIEVCVLGSGSDLLLGAGEFARNPSFFDYHAKYLDESLKMQIPAIVPDSDMKIMEDYAVQVFNSIGASVLSRVDFFYTDKGEIYFNEINTLPGYTSMSMFPSLCEKMHKISQTELIDRLVELALEKNV